jgi:broad specificity phosphatase PhoE
MPCPALGPVRGSSAFWSQAVRRVTACGPGKMTGIMVVYLVQHGEKGPRPGDPGLTGLARMQATRTGRWLDGLGVGAPWTSPMRRARETAGCIASVTGLAVQADVRLRERLN